MMAANTDINVKLREEGLPSLNYKISADYGRVETARSSTSPETEDLFGPTMNACAKINSMAPPNGMVIGSDLYYMAKKLSLLENDRYGFKRIGKKSQPLRTHEHSIESKSIVNKSNNLPIYNYNILVVDDEPDILLTFKTFLLGADPNYSVDVFTDSQKALERFSQVDRSHYSLAIMDVRMPHLNGLELYCRLKSINPEVKVIFVSALGIAEEISSILPEIKRDDVIQKPVDREDFVYKVKAALYNKN
jgi:CheY-like chemotaxis protein